MKTPTKFVGLHSHSCLSIGDAIGYPQDHIEFALKNELNGLALTDHGNMNGFSHQQIKADDLAKKGIKFKAIPGIESYFIDDLDEWRILKNKREEEKFLEKQQKKNSKKKKDEIIDLSQVGNELISTEEALDEVSQNKKVDKDQEGGTVVENEEESKQRVFDPLRQRNHLVLLPKNSEGLKALFKLTSQSFIDGFYYYPRVDLKMLDKYCKGNVIALQACLGGNLAKIIYDNLPEGDIKTMSPDTEHNFEKIQQELLKKLGVFQQVFGKENYFLEIQANKIPVQHLVNIHFLTLAERTGTKVVATADSHYSNPDHWREREIYKAMAWASKSKQFVDPNTLPKTIDELKCELYPKNASQMWNSFKLYNEPYQKHYEKFMDNISDAIDLTHTIAHEMIGEIKIDKRAKLPATNKLISDDNVKFIREKYGFNLSEEDVLFKELVQVAIDGLKKKDKHTNSAYVQRLKKELEDIKYLQKNTKFDYIKYFLTYKKIMDITTKKLFSGNGRGSVSGSMLAYVLGISQVDPIRFGTLWERFLSKKKKSAADIDNDWSDRDAAVKMLREYFGNENIIPVSNFNQLQLRSLIKDLARLYSIPFGEINKLTSRIESEALNEAKKQPGFDRQVWVLTFEEAEKNSVSFRELLEEYPDFSRTLKILFKQTRNISRHAGGVVVTNNSTESMPLITSGKELQTPWPEGLNYRHLEEFGLFKFDILGLGTLRMFEETIRKILVKEGNKNPSFEQISQWFEKNLHPDNNELDDQKVFKNVFHDGNHAGIFQFVQDNTQLFMKKMKPTSVFDIAIATSIFRPGPLSLNVDKMFLNNRNNPNDVKYQHPLLKEVFSETSGLLIYQEQLQLIYHKLANIPLEETDGIRKAFLKKDISNREKAAKEREELRETFVKLCKESNDIKESVTQEVFDNMERLVSYSFNKSHAIAYAITTYQCAFFLTYYPDEWVTTYVDYCTKEKGKGSGKEDPKAVAINEAQKLGYKMGKADINKSSYDFTVHNKVLVPSFSSMKYVGKTVVEEIERFRPYTKLTDLLINSDKKWRHSKFNKRALSTLVKLGAFDSLGIIGPDKPIKNYKQMHSILIDNFDKIKRTANKKKNNDVEALLTSLIKEFENEVDWTEQEKTEFSDELAGSVDTFKIVSEDVREELRAEGFLSIDDYMEKGSYWSIVMGAVDAVTKTGKSYLKLKLMADSNNKQTCCIWNYGGTAEDFKKFDIIVGVFNKNEYGLSSYGNTLYKVNPNGE